MKLRPRVLFACLLGLALLAGPMAAVCGDCCPAAAGETSLMASPACCGNCAPTLERSADPASVAAKKAAVEQDAVAAVAPSSASRSLIQTFPPAARAALSFSSLSFPSSAPLRL